MAAAKIRVLDLRLLLLLGTALILLLAEKSVLGKLPSSPSPSSAAALDSAGAWMNSGGISTARLGLQSDDADASQASKFNSSEPQQPPQQPPQHQRNKHRRKKKKKQQQEQQVGSRGDPTALCAAIRGLSPGQTKLCQLSHDHMPGVARGARLGIRECQHQFRHRRWNCSTLPDAGTGDSAVAVADAFGPLLDISSKESAFVHAITAAGVVYSLGRACRDGQLSSCGCSRSARPKDLNQEWVWGGCGDNLEYGYQFSQSFVDVKERERGYRRRTREHARSLMNLHNNEAGRRAVIKRSKVTCKCHGVSGSCSLITCWQQLASFREVGDYLLDKYDGATEVKVNRKGRLAIKDPHFSLPTASDLVYLDDSPNYCFTNATLGSLGTRGRTCNRTSSDIDGCNLLCCGRGYNTQKSSVKDRCDCKFHWCCRVECSTCSKSVEIHTCK